MDSRVPSFLLNSIRSEGHQCIDPRESLFFLLVSSLGNRLTEGVSILLDFIHTILVKRLHHNSKHHV